MSQPKTVYRRLPAVLIKFWKDNLEELEDLVLSLRQGPGDFVSLRSDLLAFLPGPGDPDVVEAACRVAHLVFHSSPPGAPIQALVFPATIMLDDGIQLAQDLLLEDLESGPPRLPSASVQLTGHAVRELESRWLTRATLDYTGPSGRSRSIWTLLEPTRDIPPWRNVEVLKRRVATVNRSLFKDLSSALAEKALVVSGPIGTGKTRSIFELTHQRGGRVLHSSSWTARCGGPALIKDVATRLTQNPVRPELGDAFRPYEGALANWWHGESEDLLQQMIARLEETLDLLPEHADLTFVFDDLHRARPIDVTLVERLLDHPRLGRGFRLVLIGRAGGNWRGASDELPSIEIPPLQEAEAQILWDQLTDGLSIPPAIRKTYAEVCDGVPLALEEGLLQLVRRRHLRQLYGNFFYSGPDEVEYEPTPRLLRHIESEIQRLGDATAIHVLASATSPVPPNELHEVCMRRDVDPSSFDLVPFIKSGMIVERLSTWGPGLSITCGAFSRSLLQSFDQDSVADIRQELARELDADDVSSTGAWERYQLLRGSPEAVRALLDAARTSNSDESNRLLFDALREEIQDHRERVGDEALELEMLWVFLPLARKLGLLRNLDEAIDRGIELASDDRKKRLALLLLKSDHALNAGKLRAAEQTVLDGLKIAQGLDSTRQSILLIQLGKVFQRQSRHPEARKLFEEMLARLEEAGGHALIATCHYHIGNISLHENNLTAALDHHQRGLKVRREHQQPLMTGQSLTALGAVNIALGNYTRALTLFEQAEEVLEEAGPSDISFTLLGKGRAYSRLGDLQTASANLRRALELREDSDDQTGEALARLAVAENHLQLNQIEQALREVRKTHFKLSILEATKYVADAERILGQIHIKQRQYQLAAEQFQSAFDRHRQCGDLLAATIDRGYLLEAHMALSNVPEVSRLTAELSAILNEIQYPESGESLDLRLHMALEWLAMKGISAGDPLPPLERAYRALCRKTELLDSSLRHRFLQQIPDHRALIQAATRHGLPAHSLMD